MWGSNHRRSCPDLRLSKISLLSRVLIERKSIRITRCALGPKRLECSVGGLRHYPPEWLSVRLGTTATSIGARRLGKFSLN